MHIRVNGADRSVPDETTVADLVREAGIRGAAVAVDGSVVPRGSHDRCRLTEGSRVEIVTAVQGG